MVFFYDFIRRMLILLGRRTIFAFRQKSVMSNKMNTFFKEKYSSLPQRLIFFSLSFLSTNVNFPTKKYDFSIDFNLVKN